MTIATFVVVAVVVAVLVVMMVAIVGGSGGDDIDGDSDGVGCNSSYHFTNWKPKLILKGES